MFIGQTPTDYQGWLQRANPYRHDLSVGDPASPGGGIYPSFAALQNGVHWQNSQPPPGFQFSRPMARPSQPSQYNTMDWLYGPPGGHPRPFGFVPPYAGRLRGNGAGPVVIAHPQDNQPVVQAPQPVPAHPAPPPVDPWGRTAPKTPATSAPKGRDTSMDYGYGGTPDNFVFGVPGSGNRDWSKPRERNSFSKRADGTYDLSTNFDYSDPHLEEFAPSLYNPNWTPGDSSQYE